MDSQKLHTEFTQKLEQAFGLWEKSTARFGSATYGDVSKELCMSQSQFTKLISGSATDGMYIRANRNIDRLINERLLEARATRIEQELQVASESVKNRNSETGASINRKVVWGVLILIAISMGGVSLWQNIGKEHGSNKSAFSTQHPLDPFFVRDFEEPFDPPYLPESEAQEYCPCSAWEGTWSMESPFQLPLPGSRKPGLYYVAKSADIRMKCSNLHAPYIEKGHALLGYEYLISEIWIDTKQTPLIPKYFNPESMEFTRDFEDLTFANQSGFRRVAVLHAFNVNNFEIYPDSIVRRAEITGRYATDVDETLIRTYEIDLKHILRNVLGNLTKTNCETAPNPYCDPNDLREGESLISFDCLYTIKAENLGLGGGYPYRKEFRFKDQHYSDNLTCRCESQ